MSGEEALERCRTDPDFRARYVRAYGGDESLEALGRYAAPERPRPELAASLYGRAADERFRQGLAAELEQAQRERGRVAAALRAAGGVTEPEPAALPPELVAAPARAQRAPILRWILGGVLVTGLVAGAYAAGMSGAPAQRPRPSALPTVLYFDDRDGQVARLASGPGSNGRRSVEVRLPEMLRGWSVSAACLSRSSRPSTVPRETVVLLDDRDREIGQWRVRCDTVLRRYVALAGPAAPRSVRLVLVVDEATIAAAWVTLDPSIP